MEAAAAEVFEIKDDPKHPKVPSSIRILHKKKIKLSKQLDKTFNPTKFTNIRKELLTIEAELSANRNSFLKKKEDEAIKNIKVNPKSFYKYARSKSRKN